MKDDLEFKETEVRKAENTASGLASGRSSFRRLIFSSNYNVMVFLLIITLVSCFNISFIYNMTAKQMVILIFYIVAYNPFSDKVLQKILTYIHL